MVCLPLGPCCCTVKAVCTALLASAAVLAEPLLAGDCMHVSDAAGIILLVTVLLQLCCGTLLA